MITRNSNTSVARDFSGHNQHLIEGARNYDGAEDEFDFDESEDVIADYDESNVAEEPDEVEKFDAMEELDAVKEPNQEEAGE